MTIRSTVTQPATPAPITVPSFAVISGAQAFNEEPLYVDLRRLVQGKKNYFRVAGLCRYPLGGLVRNCAGHGRCEYSL